jgi:hypothetical protein
MTARRDDMRFKSLENTANAKTLLLGIQPFGVDDDPQFIFSQRILRAISHFKLEEMPLTQSLVELHTRHTFMMDAQAVSSFCAILQRLRIPDKKNILEKIKGRVEQVAEEFNALECGIVLRSMSSPQISQRLSCTALLFAADLDGRALVDLMLSMSKGDTLGSLNLHVHCVVEWIEGPTFSAEDIHATSQLLQSCGSAAPRRPIASLLSVIQRNFVTDLTAEDAVVVLNMLRLTSYRHERLSLRLASRVCQFQKSSDALAAMQSLSHFYFANHEVFCALSSMAEAQDVCAMCECFYQVRLSPQLLFGEPLRELCGSLFQVHSNDLMHILLAALNLPNEIPGEVEKNLVCVVREAKKRSGSLLSKIDLSVSSSKFKEIVSAD